MCTRTRTARSGRMVPPPSPLQESIDIPDWTKIQPGSVTQNWKHFTRETGATASRFANTQSNKLRGIGNRRSARSRAKPHTRAPWLRGGFYFSCPRVRCARYTSSRLAHDFVTIAPFYSRRRPALTTQPRPRSESQYNPRYINL